MVSMILNARDGRTRGQVSVQPEKEFLNGRKRKVVLLLTEQLTPEETCTRPVCNIPPVINAPHGTNVTHAVSSATAPLFC